MRLLPVRVVLLALLLGVLTLGVAGAPAQAAAPTNDAFAGAFDSTGTFAFEAPGNTSEATREAGEPGIGFSVWYTRIGDRTRNVTLQTSSDANDNPDTVIEVYRGTSLGDIVLVTSNDDISSTDLFSKVTFDQVEGTRYYVKVGGFSAQPRGRFLLKLSSTTPANDAFAAARSVAAATGSTTGNTIAATHETGEPQQGPSVWYRWTAPTTGRTTFETSADASTADTVLAAYTGTSLPTLVQVALNDDADATTTYSRIDVAVQVGVSYYLQVSSASFFAGTGAFALGWRPSPPPAAVTPVPTTPVTTPGTTTTAATPAAASRVVLRAPARVRRGRAATLRISVAAPAPTGTVTVTVNGRRVAALTLVAGAASVRLPRLRKRARIVATYAGDAATLASSASRTIRIRAR